MRRLFVFLGLFLFFSPPAHAALLYLDPPQGEYGRGDSFILAVRLEPEGECVNAAHIEVAYPKEHLRAVDFSRGSSIFTLWVEEPRIDLERGTVTFSGGIPGGYCGRVRGDPVLTNILGKIVFSVIDEGNAQVTITDASTVYLNDGAGTEAPVSRADAAFQLATTSLVSGNPWLAEVGDDTTPPDAFVVEIQSTRGVFDGDYYAVFSTVDKQSGIDHYEIFERGAWKPVSSPYKLYDQALRDRVQIKAIDKAGNERLGEYAEGSAPPRQAWPAEYLLIALFLGALIAWFAFGFHRRKEERMGTAPPPQA